MPQKAKPTVSHGRKLCRSLMDAVNDVILIVDPRSFRILDANKRAVEVYGYSLRELVRKEMRDLTHDDANYSNLIRAPRSIESTHFNRAGEKIPFLMSFSLIDYWGRKAVLSINRDIAERKRIEAAITANEKKVRLLMQGMSEIIAVIAAEGRIKFISPQVERVLEIPVKELLGKSVFDFVHPDDRERAAAEYSQTIQDPGEAFPSTLRMRNQAGEWIPFEVIANNQLNNPEIAGVIFTARDLRFRGEAEETIRELNADVNRRAEERTMELVKANASLRLENQQTRHTETQLQHSLSLLYATLESTADGILVVSRDGFISGCNQKFLEMWHIPKMAVTGLRDQELLSLAAPQVRDARAFLQGVKALYATPDAVKFDTIQLKDERIFQRYTQPQRIGGEIVGRVWSFRDVTQAHRLEEELRQAQKLEAIGRLAGGVAHDFNNLLMLISGYAGQILEGAHLPEQYREDCEQLMDAAKRAASLTRELLAFSRKQSVAPQLINLNDVATNMHTMLQRLLHDAIQLVFKLNADPLPVYADPAQVELVIMNMVLNARDAMPTGGVLTIATSRKVLARGSGEQEEPATARFACLEVADTGHGMPEEIKEHIFEPFFTTKDVGQGTGLGLSTAYGIVEQAGGHITVESEPERGTTFRVFLPIAATAAPGDTESAASHVDSEIPKPGKMLTHNQQETILLVEDEAGIRAMTRVYLESQGYKVLEAADGNEALRIVREVRGDLALVLTDIIMPGMRGDELVRAIHKERPGVRAMFITGFAADALKLDAGIPVVEKPFTFPELGKRVREVLNKAESEEPRFKKVA